MNSNKDIVDKLRWQKIPLLSDGFVCLVDAMGADEDVVQAARVSYNGDTRDDERRLADTLHKLYPDIKNKTIGQYEGFQLDAAEKVVFDDETKLLRHLFRHRHTTPLEMAEVKFLIRIPMDAWRQMIRHRTANVNEYSTRYVEAIDSRDQTSPNQWRLQSGQNKQGSGGFLDAWPEDFESINGLGGLATHMMNGGTADDITPGAYLSAKEFDFHKQAHELYEERLKFGVAREQARKDLPLSTYTEAYWKCDLGNIFHYLGLRMDSHAQKEIRDYANAIGSIIGQLYPRSYQAFLDYAFNAMMLSAQEKEAIKRIGSLAFKMEVVQADSIIQQYVPDKRERGECMDKLLELGLVYKRRDCSTGIQHAVS